MREPLAGSLARSLLVQEADKEKEEAFWRPRKEVGAFRAPLHLARRAAWANRTRSARWPNKQRTLSDYGTQAQTAGQQAGFNLLTRAS